MHRAFGALRAVHRAHESLGFVAVGLGGVAAMRRAARGLSERRQRRELAQQPDDGAGAEMPTEVTQGSDSVTSLAETGARRYRGPGPRTDYLTGGRFR